MSTPLALRYTSDGTRSEIRSQVPRFALRGFWAGDAFAIEAQVLGLPVGRTITGAYFTAKTLLTDADPGVVQLTGTILSAGTTNQVGTLRFTMTAVQSALLTSTKFADVQIQLDNNENRTVGLGTIKANYDWADRVVKRVVASSTQLAARTILYLTSDTDVQPIDAEFVDDLTAGADYRLDRTFAVPTNTTITAATFKLYTTMDPGSAVDVTKALTTTLVGGTGQITSAGTGGPPPRASIEVQLGTTDTTKCLGAMRYFKIQVTLSSGAVITVTDGWMLATARVTLTAPADANFPLYLGIGAGNILHDYDVSIPARVKLMPSSTSVAAVEDRRCTKANGFLYMDYGTNSLTTAVGMGTLLSGATTATMIWEGVQYALDQANSYLTDPASGSAINFYSLVSGTMFLEMYISGKFIGTWPMPWKEGERWQMALLCDPTNATKALKYRLYTRTYSYLAGAWGTFTLAGDSTSGSATILGSLPDTASHNYLIYNANGLFGGFRCWAGQLLTTGQLAVELPNATVFGTAPNIDFRFDGSLANSGTTAAVTCLLPTNGNAVYVSDDTFAPPLVSLGIVLQSQTYARPSYDAVAGELTFAYTSATNFATLLGGRENRVSPQIAFSQAIAASCATPPDATERILTTWGKAGSQQNPWFPSISSLSGKYAFGGWTGNQLNTSSPTAVSATVRALMISQDAGTSFATSMQSSLLNESTAVSAVTWSGARAVNDLLVQFGGRGVIWYASATNIAAGNAFKLRRSIAFLGAFTSAIKTAVGTAFAALHGAVLTAAPFASTVTLTPAVGAPVPGMTYPYVVTVLDQNGLAFVGAAVTITSGTPATGTITASGTTDSSGNVALTYTPITNTGSTVITATCGAATGTLTITNANTITNTFTGADAASLAGVPCSDGIAFLQAASGPGILGITSNQLALKTANTSVPYAVARRALPSSDGTHTLTWSVIVPTVHSYYGFRHDAAFANGLAVGAEIGSTRWVLYRVVAGAATLIGSYGVSPASGDVVSIVTLGSSVIVKINGTTRITVTETNGQTNLNCDIYTADANTGQRWDNWSFTP